MKNIENTTILRNPGYQETKRHSDTMFAFNVYPCAIPTDFTFVPLHWQDSMEIIYIKKEAELSRQISKLTQQKPAIFSFCSRGIYMGSAVCQKNAWNTKISFLT